jgi:hypothetical protein
MPFHKKRKTYAKVPQNEDRIQALGATAPLTSVEKDDEERRLESLLFGKPIKNAGVSVKDHVDAEGMDFELGRELENIPDENVRSIRSSSSLRTWSTVTSYSFSTPESPQRHFAVTKICLQLFLPLHRRDIRQHGRIRMI